MANRFPLVSAGLGAIAVLALMLSFIFPWYHVYHTDVAHITEWDDRFLVNERIIVLNSDERTYSYDASASSDWQSVGDLMNRQSVYALAGIVSGIGLTLAVSFRKWMVSSVVGMATLGILIVCVYDFWSNIDSAVNSNPIMHYFPIAGLWGETTTGNIIWYYMSWGPMLGWWLIVLALLTDLILVVSSAMRVADHRGRPS